ncbi:MAG: sulfatase [Planctomycetes bacterium]|nr:sulfatase [Planctomycetota bacterium]
MSNEKRKNIIWIFGDQHRAQMLGAAGDPNIHTPNLDHMANTGVYFKQAVCGFPLCCPFRGSLISGVYPHKCVPGHEYQMPPEQKTIAHAFRDNGYHTAYFGKWHLDGWHERDGRGALHHVPAERRGGFDIWLGFENNNSQWDSWLHGHDREGKEVEHFRLPGYETDCLTDILIDYINEQSGKDEPFFASLSVQPPHDPYIAPEEFMGRHTPGAVEMRENVPNIPRILDQARREISGAYAMVENLDWNVGRVKQALVEAGIADETHIVFFSDHGDMHGSHGQFRKMTPYEESIRIPFIIGGCRDKYDGKIGTVDAVINHVDIAPTTLGLCGIDKPEWMEGTDYSGRRIHGREVEEPDSAYIQSVVPTKHGDSTDRPWRGVITRDGWKYVCLEGQPWMMYDLKEDPLEQANMAFNVRYYNKRKELQEKLRQWIEKTGDKFALPDID